jgi:prepilin-type processing-associated H-X9-DG protein
VLYDFSMLLLTILLAGASFAAFGIGGILPFMTIGLLAIIIRHGNSLPEIVHVLCILFFLLFLLACLLLPALPDVREAARRMQCSSHLKNIGLALHNYHTQYGCFSPVYVADKDGKPMHSWRVLILPFLEHRDLYERYNFNEPWDGPNNRKLLASRPELYACPCDGNSLIPGVMTTSYLAVVGANAALHRDKPTSFNDGSLQGHTFNTIMLIESANLGIQWTEPRDLDLDDLAISSRRDSVPAIRGPHMQSNGYFYHDTSAGANVGFVDGSVRFLQTSDLKPKKPSELLAIGGWGDDDISSFLEAEQLQINPFKCIALPVWLVLVILLLHQSIRGKNTPHVCMSEDTD